jgi:hypothetical protein
LADPWHVPRRHFVGTTFCLQNPKFVQWKAQLGYFIQVGCFGCLPFPLLGVMVTGSRAGCWLQAYSPLRQFVGAQSTESRKASSAMLKTAAILATLSGEQYELMMARPLTAFQNRN